MRPWDAFTPAALVTPAKLKPEESKAMLYDDPVSLREAAKLMDTSPTWIAKLRERGDLEADDAGKVSRAAVLAMAGRRKAEAEGTVREELKTRILAAKAEREELRACRERLKLERLRGELVPLTQVRTVLGSVAARIGKRLDTLPRAVFGPFKDEGNEAHAALGREVQALKRELDALKSMTFPAGGEGDA